MRFGVALVKSLLTVVNCLAVIILWIELSLPPVQVVVLFAATTSIVGAILLLRLNAEADREEDKWFDVTLFVLCQVIALAVLIGISAFVTIALLKSGN